MPDTSHTPIIKIMTAGSVDNGKSTLIARLLYNTGNIYLDHLQEVINTQTKTPPAQQNEGNKNNENNEGDKSDTSDKDDKNNKNGEDHKDHNEKETTKTTTHHEIDADHLFLPFLIDGLKAEREQGITIDVAYRYLTLNQKRIVILDTPGHTQYTGNMAMAASQANMSLVLIDASAPLSEQSKRHLFIISLFRVPHVVIAINKMDLVNFDQSRFNQRKKEVLAFCQKLEMPPLHFIPISAHLDVWVTQKTNHMPWFQGETLLHYIENATISSSKNLRDFRLPIQWTSPPKEKTKERHFMGKISSGILRENDMVTVLPQGIATRITSITTPQGKKSYAYAGQSVTITTDEHVDIHRGSLLCHPGNIPQKRQTITCYLLWINSEAPLIAGESYTIIHGAQSIRASFTLHYVIHPETLRKQTKTICNQNSIALVTMETASPLYTDSYTNNRELGHFVVVHDQSYDTIAAGLITDRPSSLSSKKAHTTPHVFWFYGLSGSGKTTLAKCLHQTLKQSYDRVILLDADDIRQTLNQDLGFTEKDRQENIRRLCELAKLFYNEKYIVIVTAITPLQNMRQYIKEQLHNSVTDIFVDTPLEVCEKRDPKGLYTQARKNKIDLFTGISSPFERPKKASITLKEEEINNAIKSILSHTYR